MISSTSPTIVIGTKTTKRYVIAAPSAASEGTSSAFSANSTAASNVPT